MKGFETYRGKVMMNDNLSLVVGVASLIAMKGGALYLILAAYYGL